MDSSRVGSDRYHPKRLLGEGGAGRVWLVEDRLAGGSLLALKELAPSSTEDEDRRSRSLRREFATLVSLHHPNLVEVHELDTAPDSGLPRFTLEYIDGSNLVDAVAAAGRVQLLPLAAEALRALAFLHDFQLLHRDLKPDNLLVRDRPKLGCRLVILDFGLARHAEESLETAAAQGTLPYMAPELFRREPATAASDLYSLGAVLFEAVHGKPPLSFDGRDLGRFMRDLGEGRRRRPELPADVPPGLAAWLDDMLAVEPSDRPSAARESLARLNDACGTDHAAETPVTRSARLLSGPPAERAETLDRLWKRLDPTSGPRVTWLVGGSGSGKTRVLRWLAADAILNGWHVVAAEAASRVELAALRASAGRQPTLLLLDIVERADVQTVELLERVAREPRRPGLQVVAARRPGRSGRPVLDRLIDDTPSVPTLESVELGPLDESGIRAMARRATGGEVAEQRVRWLHRASQGVPATAESLLVEGAWEKGRAPDEVEGGALPLGRLGMLSDAGRDWLEWLAVLRGEASDEWIAHMAEKPLAAVRAAAEDVAALGLAHRTGGRWSADSHGLMRRLLEALPADRRAAAAHRAATVLESDGDASGHDGLLASLWADAGESSRAQAAAALAAEQATAAGDPLRAAQIIGTALRWLGRERRGRHALRLRQGRALSAGSADAAAARAFGAAMRFAETPVERLAAATGRAGALVRAGRFRLALAAAEQAVKLASERGADEQRAQALKAAGMALGRLGREREALELLETARELLAGDDDPKAEAELHQLIATCRLRLGDAGAETEFRRSIEAYAAARAPTNESADAQELKARIGLAVIKIRRGEYGEATELLERVRGEAEDQANLALQQAASSSLARVAIESGRPDEAIAIAERAVDLALHLGDPNRVLVDRCRLADAQIRCGRAGDAVVLLRNTLDGSSTRIEPENVDFAGMLLAEAWMETSYADPVAIRRLLQQTLDRCRRRGKPRALSVALALEMKRRSAPGCPEPFDPVEAEFRDVAAENPEALEPEIRIRADLARATYRLGRGDPEPAKEAARAAAAAARHERARAFEAEASGLLADALRRTGRDGDAEEALREGRRALEAAAGRLGTREDRERFLGRPAFAGLAATTGVADRKEQGRLRALYDMIRAVNSETDPEALLETILDMALRVVHAQRGMILLKEESSGDDPRFAVHLVRDLDPQTASDAESYSRSIVAAAGQGRSLLAIDAGNDDRFRELKSVSLYSIRSLMCVPLRSRGSIVGTVYLDCCEDGLVFTDADLQFVEAFADHAGLALSNVLQRVRLENENRRLQAAAETRTRFANIVGRSSGMQKVFDLIEKVAATDLPVLVQGESGTGKELVAQAIHFNGLRRRCAFVSENCSALPATLLESELFGHVRGAFTGAERDHPGLFEQADGGSLFLDEIGDMSAEMQARMLRVLQEREIRRVGGEESIAVDVRIVAATHRDLAEEVRAGRFREDLMYRLQVVTIELPPLRERPGDIALLTHHFLGCIARDRGREPVRLDDDVLALFERYAWPGNVRQLENTLQRLTLLAGSQPISVAVVESDPGLGQALLPEAASSCAPSFSLKLAEKEQVQRALEAAGGNRSRAAELLNVSRATLYRKMREHQI
ncbi:MAG: protein kinase [bacterium]|nr:protein kinase [bacterium]